MIKMTPEQRRKLENDELVERFKKNETRPTVSREAMAFPPRPVIKKDHAIMKRLYDGDNQCQEKTSTENNDHSNDSSASRGKKQTPTLKVL